MINRSESQLIARDQHNQVQKSAKPGRKPKPVRSQTPKGKTARS